MTPVTLKVLLWRGRVPRIRRPDEIRLFFAQNSAWFEA